MAGIEKAIAKICPRIAAKPEKALAGIAATATLAIEAAPVVLPVAIVGAAGYGIYRLGKCIFE